MGRFSWRCNLVSVCKWLGARAPRSFSSFLFISLAYFLRSYPHHPWESDSKLHKVSLSTTYMQTVALRAYEWSSALARTHDEPPVCNLQTRQNPQSQIQNDRQKCCSFSFHVPEVSRLKCWVLLSKKEIQPGRGAKWRIVLSFRLQFRQLFRFLEIKTKTMEEKMDREEEKRAKGERQHGLECSGFWENLLTSPAGKQEACH